MVEQADDSAGWPGWLAPVSAELAAGLLDDGMAASMPKWQRRLVNLALAAMDGPMPPSPRSIAIGLSGAASGHNLIVIRDAIRAALGGPPLARAIAADIETHGSFGQLIRADWKSPTRPRLDTVITGRARHASRDRQGSRGARRLQNHRQVGPKRSPTPNHAASSTAAHPGRTTQRGCRSSPGTSFHGSWTRALDSLNGAQPASLAVTGTRSHWTRTLGSARGWRTKRPEAEAGWEISELIR